jgi:hypothetical protein
MYAKPEIMFPNYVIPVLREACGPEWRKLIERVAALDEGHPESLAFSLMMIRLGGCLDCETDSFRAMRGCAACALQTVRRYRANEKEILKLYKGALKDVQEYLVKQPSSLVEAPLLASARKPARRVVSQPIALAR